jgi:hypothetical protein
MLDLSRKDIIGSKLMRHSNINSHPFLVRGAIVFFFLTIFIISHKIQSP